MADPSSETSKPVGIILAGGASRRMGGGKPFRLLAGRRLIDLALENIHGVCTEVAVVTDDPVAMADLDCHVIADRWPGRGPLFGIMTAFLDTGADSILVMPVDMPLVNPKALAAAAAAAAGQRAAALEGDRFPEPLLACYNRPCLALAKGLVSRGVTGPWRLLASAKAAVVSREDWQRFDPAGLTLLNVNNPQDLAKAEKILAGRVPFDTP